MSTRSTSRAALQTTTSPKRRSTISLFKRILFVLVPVFLAAAFAQAQPAPGMYGSDRDGTLFSIDCNTGATVTIGGPINPVGPGSTEIEYDNIGGLAVTQSRNGNFTDNFFDMTTGLPTSASVANGFSHTSLEYVGPTLFSYVIGSSGGASTLHTLLPGTGTSTPIGGSGLTFPISGLAYDVGPGIMYGISGGGGGGGTPGTLVTANLVTGAATVVGLTGIGTFGSLQFCSDGSLLAGGDNTNGGNLYKINKATGAATLLAPSGFANVTGLTLVIGTTAAAVSVGGRVLTPKGRGISRALVHITDQDGDIRTASTNHFGYFKFDEVEVGRAYIFNVFSKQYQFATQVVKVNDQLTDLNFIAQ